MSGKSESKGQFSSPRRAGLAAVLLAAVFAAWAVWHFVARRGTPQAGDQGHPAAQALRPSTRIAAIRNVLLVSIDTCRADHLSCYGRAPRTRGRRPTTPNIDAAAQDGALFKMALTPVPLTTPAHSSMLTGTYPPTHGVHLNFDKHLADTNVTLARILRGAGYQTAAFVGGLPLDAMFGLNQGFDSYDGHFAGTKSSARDAEAVNLPALAWLEGHAQRPFFLFLHYYDAHHPYAPHPPYTSAYTDDPYAGEIAYVDHCIGRVLDRLRALGLYDNTLLILTGDHGEGLGEHGETAHAFFIYQSTLHVPLVIRAPGCRKGIQVDENVSLVDIVPTVLDLLGLERPARLEGVDLRAALEGGPANLPSTSGRGAGGEGPRSIYCESLEAGTYACSPLHGILEGPWKYILAPRQELYDLSRDPGEGTNLAARKPQVVKRLRGRLEEMLKRSETVAAQHNRPAVAPETVKQLQTLGYASGGAAPPASAPDVAREDPKDFLPIYERLFYARGLFRTEHRKAEAKKKLLEIAALRPELVEPQQLLGDMALEEQRPADAVGHFTGIVGLLTAPKDPARQPLTAAGDLAAAHFKLGLALQTMGKSAEAIGHYKQALQIAPDYADAHVNLGNLLAGAGKFEEAIAHCRRALELKPDSAEAHYNLGYAMARCGQVDDAIVHFQKAVEIESGYAEAHYNLGYALAGRGQVDEAITHFQKAVEIKPDYVDAQNNLGAYLLMSGRADEAIIHFRKVLEIDPQNAHTAQNLAIAQANQERALKELARRRERLRAAPKDAALLVETAWLLATDPNASIRNGREAVGLAQQAVQLTGGKDPAALDALAAAFAEADRFAEAVQAARKALDLAKEQNNQALAEPAASRLKLYQARTPYRAAMPPPTDRAP